MGTLPREGTVTVEVAASPEQVWAVLADVTRAGDWGHESQPGEWLDGATTAVPGARFQGRNRKGRTKWTRVCEVLEADAPRRITWRTVPSRLYNDSTRWTYEVEPTEAGCRITQRFEVLKLGPVMDRLFYALIPAHRDRSEALRADLVRLGEVAAGAVVTPSA
jgi:hypothetical protein